MAWEDHIDPDVFTDDELGTGNPQGPVAKDQQLLATLTKRLTGIKNLGDAFTDPTDPPDPNGFYTLIATLGGDVTQLVEAVGDTATADTLLALLDTGNDKLDAITTALGNIDTTLQAIGAVLAIGNTNTAVIVAQLIAVNSNLVLLTAATDANS